MEIIRNCSHYSATSAGLEMADGADPLTIIKTAFNEEGSASIGREREGLLWYEEQLHPENSVIGSFRSYKNSFARLELLYKEGSCGDLSLSVEQNYAKIINAVNHHIDIFENRKSNMNHGDFSIENVIFKKDDVVWVVDWEGFTDMLPFGFDLIYCVMEACFFSFKRRGHLTRNDVKAAKDILIHIGTALGRQAISLKAPSQDLYRLFLDNKKAFGHQLLKYPFYNSSQEDILKLDLFFQKW